MSTSKTALWRCFGLNKPPLSTASSMTLLCLHMYMQTFTSPSFNCEKTPDSQILGVLNVVNSFPPSAFQWFPHLKHRGPPLDRRLWKANNCRRCTAVPKLSLRDWCVYKATTWLWSKPNMRMYSQWPNDNLKTSGGLWLLGKQVHRKNIRKINIALCFPELGAKNTSCGLPPASSWKTNRIESNRNQRSRNVSPLLP